jgi:predicted ArsR family transcriptional regulator
MKELLDRMAAIERMERGAMSQMSGRPYYNHQTWREGRNEVRYVPKDEVAELQKDIAGYQLFTRLAEQYADEVIRASRREKKKRSARMSS